MLRSSFFAYFEPLNLKYGPLLTGAVNTLVTCLLAALIAEDDTRAYKGPRGSGNCSSSSKDPKEDPLG